MCHFDEEGGSNEGASLPVDHLALSLTGDHVQQCLPEVVPDAAVADHLVPEDNEAQVVDILHVVLLNVHSVLEERGGGAYISNAITQVPSDQPLKGCGSANP